MGERMLATLALAALATANVDPDCVVVDTFLHPDETLADGDGTCFPSDDRGMVCGWDGTEKEAYCTEDTGNPASLVCARKKGGGRCEDVVHHDWLPEDRSEAWHKRKE